MTKNFTWVQGERDVDQLDDTSRRILAGGRKPAAFGTEGNISAQTGTSIFDPVLCELAYRWFSPPDGLVLDPFAGGSVRGIVANLLGRRYCGVDLLPGQLAANRAQAEALCKPPLPEWREGDARDLAALCEGIQADLLFTCPPYADLERYSDDPRDLSTLAYGDFLPAYRQVIAAGSALLRPHRFAVIVVGEVRGPEGNYYGFVPDTVRAFTDAGLAFYNEAILVTAAGSLPIRAGKQFRTTRKLGKTHQNVLVFVKGDPRAAVAACGDVQVDVELTEALLGEV